jgi:predicted transcriptional regulator
MIVAALRRAETGYTREELSAETEITLQAVCARAAELVQRGWVRESGATRKTRQQSAAGVLVLTDAARTELGESRS